MIRQKRCDAELESLRDDYEGRLNVVKLENDNLKKQVVDLQKNLDESRNNEEVIYCYGISKGCNFKLEKDNF